MTEELLIITGIAGAGKSTAINFFEDRGYLAIDNLPVVFYQNFVKLIKIIEKSA